MIAARRFSEESITEEYPACASQPVRFAPLAFGGPKVARDET
jgi:hypothetical protein